VGDRAHELHVRGLCRGRRAGGGEESRGRGGGDQQAAEHCQPERVAPPELARGGALSGPKPCGCAFTWLRRGSADANMCSIVIVCVLLPRFELAVAAGGRAALLQGPAALAPEPGREAFVGEVSAAAETFGIHPGM